MCEDRGVAVAQAQQKTCSNLRRERDAAREAEHQALVRAAAFETERDKIQRQFKVRQNTDPSTAAVRLNCFV